MKKFISCVLFLCICNNTLIFTQTNLRHVDTRTRGMGGNGVTNTVLSNPASLSLSTNQFIEINYFNKYLLKELSSTSVVYGNPNPVLPFAVNITTFGYDAYRETMFRLALSKSLSAKCFAGISVQYSLLQTELYDEEAKRLSTDVGILFIPGEKLLIGLSISDFVPVRFDDKSINIKDFNYYSIQTGIKWKFIDNLLITASANYMEKSYVDFGSGIEYAVFDNFFLRTGFSINPLVPSFGSGIKFSSFQLDVAADYHSLLGISSGVGICYSF